MAGLVGGALWGGLVGWLKAVAGAHEGDRHDHAQLRRRRAAGLPAHHHRLPAAGRTDPISPIVDWNATFPRLAGTQLHLGFLVALLAAVVVLWLLERSTTGFAIRAVGANPHAAATAGMSVARTTIITMAVAGALAGLAGVQAALGPSASGLPVPLSAGIVGSIGFDAHHRRPARPLDAARHRAGGLLFGALHAGGLAHAERRADPAHPHHRLQALIVLSSPRRRWSRG